MTAAEIIDETVEWYRTHPRSKISRTNQGIAGNTYITVSCAYFGEGGVNCAFSRCCNLEDPLVEKKLRELDAWDSGGGLSEFYGAGNFQQATGIPLDSLLADQYTGQPFAFWSDLQSLHDVDNNWKAVEGGNELSDAGILTVNHLKAKYS